MYKVLLKTCVRRGGLMKKLNDISWNEYSNGLAKQCASLRIPQSGTFELTPLCNFHCKMCYVRLDKNQMEKQGRMLSAQEWINLGKSAIEAGTLFLLLTGGEIFSRDDFQEIYEGLSELGFVIVLFTNGYLINDDTIEYLKKMPPAKLRITMYGASDETYERVCGIKNGYTVVTKVIEKLVEAGIPVGIAMTIIKENSDDFEAVQAYAKSLDLQFNYTYEIEKPVRGARSEAECVRYDYGNATELMHKNKDEIDQMFPKGNNRMIFPNATNKVADVCGAMNRCFWITWNGKMSMCTLISSIQEDILQLDFKKAWNQLCDRLSELKRPDKCNGCQYINFCNACPGVLESETGDPEMISERICKKAQAYYEVLMKDQDE